MVAPWDIYAEKLFPLGYGHPLWAPEPSLQFGEVRIGDVGFLSNGRFRFLFNCTREANDPLNLRGTPTPFEPLTIPPGSLAEIPNEITQPLLQSQGMHSVSGQGQGTIGDPTTGGGAQASLRYKCTEQSGALLMLKQAGHATRLDCTRAVQKYMRQNLEHWHLFATDRLGIDLQDSDLIFVYGYTKTTVWAEAAFSSSSTDGELVISAGTPALGASGSFSVELSKCQLPITFHRWGPHERASVVRELDALATTPSTSAIDDTFDQCIFLNYFKMKSRFRRRIIRAAAGPHELPSSPPDDSPVESDEVRDSDAIDPACLILDYILETTANADYAWVSDQDVSRMSRHHTVYEDTPALVAEKSNATAGSSESTTGTAMVPFIVTDHGLGSLAWKPLNDLLRYDSIRNSPLLIGDEPSLRNASLQTPDPHGPVQTNAYPMTSQSGTSIAEFQDTEHLDSHRVFNVVVPPLFTGSLNTTPQAALYSLFENRPAWTTPQPTTQQLMYNTHGDYSQYLDPSQPSPYYARIDHPSNSVGSSTYGHPVDSISRSTTPELLLSFGDPSPKDSDLGMPDSWHDHSTMEAVKIAQSQDEPSDRSNALPEEFRDSYYNESAGDQPWTSYSHASPSELMAFISKM